MPKQPAPCGTYTAYKRHKRNKETPCDACQIAQREHSKEANRVAKEKEAADFQAAVVSAPKSELKSRLDTLKTYLLTLETAITAADASKIAPLGKELRETLKEIEEIQGASPAKTEVDPYEHYFDNLDTEPERLPGT